jgi:peptidoglycan/xylan/chitin deacetylase (PgdA/CDA1 family)
MDASSPPPVAPPKMAPPAQGGSVVARLKRLAADALPRAVLVRQGSPKRRRVALTFDDGPHALTDAYLDVLERFGARATFFVVGKSCALHLPALRHAVARGHELAGHGFTHTAFPKLDAAALRDELDRTAALLPPARAGRRLVRPPTGATSLRSLALCARAGYTTVLWSRDSDDCRTTSPDDVAARLAPELVQAGDIVLLHESQSWTLAALPRILEGLQRAGLEAVTVSELLDDGGAS